MARYSHLYAQEEEEHAKTRHRLAVANDFVAAFREFVRARGLQNEVLEFVLSRHLGETEARRILDECKNGQSSDG